MPSTAWEEVSRARQEHRRELVLAGKILAARLAQTGGAIDPTLFDLTELNFLDLSSCPDLRELPPLLSRLGALTTLILSGDGLTELPAQALGGLAKLKVLNLSQNAIESFPEEAVAGMVSLTTMNLSLNRVSSMPSLESLSHLSHVDLSGNSLENIEFLCHASLVHLAEVLVGKNNIAEIPSTISCLSSLKKLDASGNQLAAVPGDLADCLKMKELLLKENPFKDNRFKKMVAQKGTKAVVDYIRQHFPKGEAVGDGEAGAGGSSGKKGKGGKKAAKKAAAEKVKEEAREARRAEAEAEGGVAAVADLLEVLHVGKDAPRVVSGEEAKEGPRPYIVCFVARNLDLSSPGVLKRFIQSQTRLHETVCQKRVAATIATHDLAKIPSPSVGPVTYSTRPPTQLKIVPLGQAKEVDGETLVARLRADAEQQRKEKKRSSVSGVHQYLKLLKGDAYACLEDAKGRVISFPPITNCDGTKICESTRDILVEVTSGAKLQTAKEVADSVIQEMLELGLGRPAAKSKGKGGDDRDFYSSSSDEEEEAGTGASQPKARCLRVEQVRVEDAEGNLRVLYPSKTDLAFAQGAVDRGDLVIERH